MSILVYMVGGMMSVVTFLQLLELSQHYSPVLSVRGLDAVSVSYVSREKFDFFVDMSL